MPNHKAAQLLAEHLHDLPHPDGTALRDAMAASAHDSSVPQAQREGITALTKGRAEAIVHLIETNGGQVIMPGDVETPPPAPDNWIEVKCLACGNVIQRINSVHPNLPHARTFLQAMRGLSPDCPHHSLATRA